MNTSQLNLLNDPEAAAQLLTEQAVDSARRGADQDWWASATRGVRVVAKNNQYFTSDDVWYWLRPLQVKTHDPRAMGAVMRLASRDRTIEPTSEFRSSSRPACHRRPVRIWKSLTYKTDEA